ncbi:hypothetical protein [Streptomyces sp. NBC_00059]|uniref:hypothetical protein n=1 Tax=Streptomyces sp. NBC_00059 TaxID=2975635 RepID=UPI002256B9EB|nr:hypothetical protein [Streptomyces sp. NBC_00059]MCX5415518.1 hypothetical protein [Streptomyces sp. NBC_00059]
MTDHRPLSIWTATAPVPSATTGAPAWPRGAVVNDGDERADARRLPKFAHGWQRRGVPMEQGRQALGLVHRSTGEAVVELDELAMPVPVTEAGLRVVTRIEEGWPDVTPSAADTEVLAGEQIEVRRLLLARLADEGRPPAELFHILPWHRVTRLADEIDALLHGGVPGEVIRLRHWFRSVGPRFTASLEQLDEGVRDDDPGLIRVAATSLCARLTGLEAARLPAHTRVSLAALVEVLAEGNRFLGHTAARVTGNLRGEGGSAPAAPRMDTVLLDAGASDGIRRESQEFERAPFTVRVAVTSTGHVTVSAHTVLRPGEDRLLTEGYGVMLLPFRILAAEGSTRYWVVLEPSEGFIGGSLPLPVPTGDFVEADVDGPPIGVLEAASLGAEEVERSIAAVDTGSYLDLWERIADALPPSHPLRDVIGRAVQ